MNSTNTQRIYKHKRKICTYIRLNEREVNVLKYVANIDGVPYTTWVRQVALRIAKKRIAAIKAETQKSGAEVIDSAPG